MNAGPLHIDHPGGWVRHDWSGSAADFHALEPGAARALWWCSIDVPALILGSSQPASDLDVDAARAAGFDVVRRRSGGGLVPVGADAAVWIDVTIPHDDPLWVDDVTKSMTWLGDVFVRALAPWVGARVHGGSFEQGIDGRTVCFASASPGEVFVGDSKLVGISQRRGRYGARMQCVLYRRWEPDLWAGLLTDRDVAVRAHHLQVATVDAPPADIVSAVFAALPA